MDELTKQDIINLVKSNFRESQKYLDSSGYTQEFKDWNDLYRGVPDDKPFSWMSNKFIKMIQSKVDTAVANIMGMLFSIKPPINIKAKPYSQGDEYHAGIKKMLLARQTEDKAFFSNFMQYVKGVLTFGTFHGIVRWDTDYRKVRVKNRQQNPIINFLGRIVGMQPGNYQESEETIELRDGPVFEPLNIGDCFPDPAAIEVEDGFFSYVTRVPLPVLVRQMKSPSNEYGIYNEDVLLIGEGDFVSTISDEQNIAGSMGRLSDAPVTRGKLTGNVKIINWCGEYDINGDGVLETCWFSVAADKYLIRAEEAPMYYTKKPIIKSVYVPQINQYFGIGLPEMLEECQNGLNESFNQTVDYVTFALNPIEIYAKSADVDHKAIMRPGAKIGADTTDAIRFERPPDVIQGVFPLIAEYERWAQEISAITKMTVGMAGPETGKTATAAAILSKTSSDRFMISAKIIEESAFSKIVRIFDELNYQLLDEYKVGAMLNIDPMSIDWGKMRPDSYTIEAAGVRTIEERNQKALKLLQFLNIAQRFPFIKIRVIIEKLYTLLDISDNPQEIFMTEDEQRAQLLQQLVQMRMMGGKPGDSGGEGEGPGRESTQFSGSEVKTPGMPPVTTQAPPNNMMS